MGFTVRGRRKRKENPQSFCLFLSLKTKASGKNEALGAAARREGDGDLKVPLVDLQTVAEGRRHVLDPSGAELSDGLLGTAHPEAGSTCALSWGRSDALWGPSVQVRGQTQVLPNPPED